MADWCNDMAAAPRDGTPIEIRTFDGAIFAVEWTEGFMNEHEADCGCWVEAFEDTAPPCWTDGVCWASNADNSPSDPPIAWRSISQ